MWQIQATVTRRTNGWSKTIQVPTFEIDENLHGIITEKGAISIAEKIINPAGLDLTVSVCAVRLA